MTPQERQSTTCLASIYAFRMLGLFMILPIFSLYTHRLTYANEWLIGIALGVYGLTQAILQIPFGMASDRIGRKPVILFGLILFILGSVIAALSHDIYGIIIGRALQGAGAIGSTLIALLADTTEDKNRLKAMSAIGMTIGLSFMLAMIIGPILNAWIGLSGIFWLTAILACFGIFLLYQAPNPQNTLGQGDRRSITNQFSSVLKNPELLRLNFGIFCLHAILTALFIVVPLILMNQLNFAPNQQWLIYLPVLVLGCIFMIPFVVIAETKGLIKPIFLSAIMLLTLASLFLGLLHLHLISMNILLCIFFTAFTLLESILPSLISKIAPQANRGTAMGIYSTCQFFGIFIGGSIGGLVANYFGNNAVFYFCTFLGLIWFLFSYHLQKPGH